MPTATCDTSRAETKATIRGTTHRVHSTDCSSGSLTSAVGTVGPGGLVTELGEQPIESKIVFTVRGQHWLHLVDDGHSLDERDTEFIGYHPLCERAHILFS